MRRKVGELVHISLFVLLLQPEKDSLNIWFNGELREETGEFVDDGTNTEWEEDGVHFVLLSRSSGNKKTGIVYELLVNGELIAEVDQ